LDKLLELIQEKAGISADQAKSAVSAVADFLGDKLPAPIASQVQKFLGDEDGGNGDDDGGLMGKVTGMFGGGD
jgi:hypothetical protein